MRITLAWIELVVCVALAIFVTWATIIQKPLGRTEWGITIAAYLIVAFFALSSSLTIWGK